MYLVASVVGLACDDFGFGPQSLLLYCRPRTKVNGPILRLRQRRSSRQSDHDLFQQAYIRQMADKDMFRGRFAAGSKTPGFTTVGIFFFFGAVTASFAAITLLWQGTALDRLWEMNPSAHRELAPLGNKVGVLFLLLAASLTMTGIGWFRRRRWGWRLAIIIIATQVLGDIVNCVRGDLLRGGIGLIIAGALFLFLLQRKLRATFG
jgi:hypothetical protein